MFQKLWNLECKFFMRKKHLNVKALSTKVLTINRLLHVRHIALHCYCSYLIALPVPAIYHTNRPETLN